MDRARITNAKILGVTLRTVRERAGLSQMELADRLDITQRYVSELETGKKSLAIDRLLDAFEELGAVVYVEVPEARDG